MKRGIFTLLFAVLSALCYAQTTYYWVGGAGPISFTANSSWNTNLDGSGSPRTAMTTDVLIVDGTNIGGSSPATGPIVAIANSITVAKLQLQNNADLTFTRTSTGTGTITLGGDQGLAVFASCKLRLSGSTGSVLVALTPTSSALIQGDLFIEELPGGSTIQNRFTSRAKGAFVFASGSSITTKTNAYTPFGSSGSSTTPVADGVIFESGASYYYEGGQSPFGTNSSSTHVDFRPGSNFYFRAPSASNMFTNRKYANVFIQNNTTVTADGSLIKLENLTIDAGSTLKTHNSGTLPVNGNIVNNGSIVPADDPDDRNNKLVMINSTAQTIGGTGTYTISDLIISNVSNVTLNKSIKVDTITRVIGLLNPNGNAITGTGTTSVKTAASIPVTGNLNIDSFLVKNISDFTGIEVGMSASGTGIPANTIVVNTSTSAGTITLSKAVTSNVTYGGAAVALTIFNGDGVLPIHFGGVSATIQNAATVISWKMANEENTNYYTIERTTGSNQFKEIGKVNASRNGQYSFTDANPLNGSNLYRIKAVDNDGKTIFSSIVKVDFGGKNLTLELFPNPVASVLSIAGLQGGNKVRILDMSGRLVSQSQLSQGVASFNMDVSGLKKGNYVLEVTGVNGKQTRSFIKF